MRYAEYLLLPEGSGYSLVDGFLCHEPAPPAAHGVAVRKILQMLRRHARTAGPEARALRHVNVHLDPKNSPVPDVCYISAERASSLGVHGVEGIAPDLCVEVLSPRTARRDRGVKAGVYARHGCREYWLVDPQRRRVEVFIAAGQDRFTAAGAYGAHESFTSTVCEGLRIDVDAVLPEA